MRLPKFLLAAVAGLALATPATAKYRDTSVPMSTVNVSVPSYMGKWYEIARYPNQFERNCEGVTAEYGMKSDGKVSVLNTCRKGSPSATPSSRGAEARPVGPGQFKVNFVKWLPMAEGDYWVLYVDPSYQLAVVGEPTGRYGWILARSPQVTQSQLNTAKSVLEKNGYDTSQLRFVAH